MEKNNAFHGVGIVDDGAVGKMRCPADLAEPNLWTLRYGCNVLDLDGGAVGILDHRILDILHTRVKAERLDIHLLRSLFYKTAAAI